MQEVDLAGLYNSWPVQWQAFASRLSSGERAGLGVSNQTMRKILDKLGCAVRLEQRKVEHVHEIGDAFPLHSNQVTDLEYHCSSDVLCVQNLCRYLRSPVLWRGLKSIRVFKLAERPLSSIVLHTPSVHGYSKGSDVWDEQLAFKRRVLSLYTRATMYVVETTQYQIDEDLANSAVGQIVLAERDSLEAKDGAQIRFGRDKDGIVSEARAEPGFVIADEVGPVVAYDYGENYRRWMVSNVVFIPASLDNEQRFIEMCSHVRQMVSADAYFSVLLLDYFIGRGTNAKHKILKKAPPVFKSPMIKYRDHRLRQHEQPPPERSFVHQNSLVGVKSGARVPVVNGLRGLPPRPPPKRIFTGGTLATTFVRGEQQEKHVCRREAAGVDTWGNDSHFLEDKPN